MDTPKRKTIPTFYLWGAAFLAVFSFSFLPAFARIPTLLDGGEGAGALLVSPGLTAVPPSWVFRYACLAAALCCFANAFARAGDALLRAARWARGQIGDWWVVGTAAVISAIVAAALAHFSLGREGHVWDEREFDFQARIFAAGHLTAAAPPTDTRVAGGVISAGKSPLALRDANIGGRYNFLVGLNEGWRDAKWFTIYTPVWPLILAVGELCGHAWLVNPVLGMLTAFMLFGLGKRLFGADAALLAVFLYAISPFSSFNNASFFSEPAFLLLLLSSAWALDVGRENGRFLPNASGGFLLALAFGAREYAAAAAALPVVAVWLAAVVRRPGRARPIIAFAAGFAAGVMPLLGYNSATSGNPFTFPRAFSSKTHFGLEASFVAGDMVLNTTRRLWVLATDALGWPLLSVVPALVPLLTKRTTPAARWLYAIALSTLVLFILPQHKGINYGARYYYGALPALFLVGGYGLTLLPARLNERWRLRRGTTAAAVALLTLGTTLPYYAAVEPVYRSHWGFTDGKKPWVTPELEEAFAAYGVWQAVVFVSPPERCDGPAPNDVNLRNHMIYAHDRGPRNAEFAALVPRRPYLRVDYTRFEETGEIEVITLPVLPPKNNEGNPRRPSPPVPSP